MKMQMWAAVMLPGNDCADRHVVDWGNIRHWIEDSGNQVDWAVKTKTTD